MSLPDIATLYEVTSATWPAAEVITLGPITLRRGHGGGSRVSAATAEGPVADTDIAEAERGMVEMGQPALFMIRKGEDALDAQLARLGYSVQDPVTFYAANVDPLCTPALPPKTAFPAWPPLAAQHEVWRKGGIGPARLQVMDRACSPKTAILGRTDERPAGTVFVAIHNHIAMLHALEIDADHRRRGLARYLTQACAIWARDNGARYLSLITTNANVGANALYASLGMTIVGHYHYRTKPEPPK